MARASLLRVSLAFGILAHASAVSAVHSSRRSERKKHTPTKASQMGLDRTGAYIAEEQRDHSEEPAHMNVLAVVSHYVPGRAGGESRRNAALHETLQAMHEWPKVTLNIYLLTNKFVEDAQDMVKDQIIVSKDEPVCSENWKHKFCVPWEAIRVLRSGSTGDKPSTKLGYELTKEPKYDAYIYTESDIIMPEPTFHFWRSHVDSLYRRGFLLLPMRAEDKLLTNDVIAVDCFEEQCVNKTEVLRDDDGSIAMYKTNRDRHYLRPFNPYSGCFMMSKEQFKDYLNSPMWDYHKVWEHKLSPWGVRETAASGLLWAPGFGKETGLTHLKMRVWHQIPMNGVGKGDPKARIDPSRFHKVDEYHDKITGCMDGTVKGPGQCGQLTPLSMVTKV